MNDIVEQETSADPYEEAEVLRIMNGTLQDEVNELRQEKYRLTVETRNKSRLMTRLQEQVQTLQSQITFLSSVSRDAQDQPTPEEMSDDQDRIREG